MVAYRAMPATGGNFPVILVVSEVFGVHEYVKDVCRRIAKNGYFAIAPELFARLGDASKYTDINKLLQEIVAKTPDAQIVGDFDACVAYAKESGKAEVTRLGITGFCWGGRVAYMYAAHNPNVKAVVVWYGQPARSFFAGDKTPMDVAGQIKAPVLGLYGGADQGIPSEQVEKMFAALKASGNAKSEYTIYPDAQHAFHADYRPSYRKQAAEDGWNKMLAWFKLNL
jgi:carboxymethylenebutenolidase